jgi:hypothetical protein
MGANIEGQKLYKGFKQTGVLDLMIASDSMSANFVRANARARNC